MRASHQFPRFVAVGAASTLMHVAVYALAYREGLQPVAANVLAYTCALVFSYVGHFHVSFAMSGSYARYAGRFVLTSLAGLILSTAVVQLAVSSAVPPYGALLLVVLITPSFSFVANRFWAFSRSRPPSSVSSAAAVALPLSVLAWCVLDGTQLNHDSSWYLVATERWLAGAELYRDVLEINPPLSFYLTAPAILLAQGVGIDAAIAFRLLVLMGAALSAIASTVVLRRSLSLSVSRSSIFTFFAGVALLLVPVSDFGQREHLMLVFSLPLLTLLVVGQDRADRARSLVVPVALFGVLGIALKPHFILPIALIALVELLVQKRWKVLLSDVHLIMLAALLAYVAYVAVVHPGYFGFMVPLGVAVYGYGETDLRTLVQDVLPIIIPALAATALVRRGGGDGRVLMRACAVLLGFGLAYVVQFKGWSYQLVPVRGFAVVIVGLALTLGIGASRNTTVLSALLFLVVLWNSVSAPLRAGPYLNHIAVALEKGLDGIEGIESMAVLSTNVSAGFPLVRDMEVSWASRFPTMWLVPGIVDSGDPPVCVPDRHSFCAERMPASEFLRASIVEDFVEFDVDVVIVDVRARKSYVEKTFDYLEFMYEEERFEALWKDFELLKTVGSYEIWRRTGS